VKRTEQVAAVGQKQDKDKDEGEGLKGAELPEPPQPADRAEAKAFRSACRHYARLARHLRG
jgi:hypothetical protein